MSRRKRGLEIHGVVLLDKPVGISSNRALQKVRGIFQARKAGHTGSLDPFATGMLPICLGEASKTAAFMLEASKQYRAVARLGEATSTGDVEGEVIQTYPVPDLDSNKLTQTLNQFVGEIEQVPPMYSALKHQGKPLYEYARAGIEIERPARLITIHQLDLVDWQAADLTFDVRCSKGTYIRTLAEDIATALGSCAHLIELRRMLVEPFADFPMVTLEQLQEARDHGGGGCRISCCRLMWGYLTGHALISIQFSMVNSCMEIISHSQPRVHRLERSVFMVLKEVCWVWLIYPLRVYCSR